MEALAEQLVLDVREGRPISRRDTVALARAVLQSEVVRAAEAVLEADDALLMRLALELAEAILGLKGKSVGFAHGHEESDHSLR